MICPHLKRTVMPICQAKKGALMAPNIYELEYYCMNSRYKGCPVFKENRWRTKAEKGNKEVEKDVIV